MNLIMGHGGSWCFGTSLAPSDVSECIFPIQNNDCMGCMHCVKFVPFLLAYYHDDNSGESWVSLERLAAESLHTETEVIRILKAL